MNPYYSPTATFASPECLGENDHLLAWREVERDPATTEAECVTFNLLQLARRESVGFREPRMLGRKR